MTIETERPIPPPLASLRERKKEKTRAAIKHNAYRLFSTQGYEGTTVDQIAAACDISSKTFFRYFPTKESVLIEEIYPSRMVERFAAQPHDIPLVEAMRVAVHEAFGDIDDDTLEDMRTRNKLIMSTPELRGAYFSYTSQLMERIAAVAADRIGTSSERIEPTTFSWIVHATLNSASTVWLQREPGQSFVAIADEAFDFVNRVATY